ncbi:uncharacterized protein BDZ83DRAFT_450619 [Colletotrichum acutatum]|uniref:Uncharacterized protein n=1 Tax=Glomerella acutata TaxID=27357 RepID=A0AAD8XM64_GLOAC|nr:uncharacterized protein BDZ83DRAFT_450619 [Colletotrichum acutatum]KAK1729945.1 hypothetical protein BDZ83DRAFT_450619 [Colletotrichum acutatum]
MPAYTKYQRCCANPIRTSRSGNKSQSLPKARETTDKLVVVWGQRERRMSGTSWALLRAVREMRSGWPNGLITACSSMDGAQHEVPHTSSSCWTSQATSGHYTQGFGSRSDSWVSTSQSLFPDSFEKVEVDRPQVIRDRGVLSTPGEEIMVRVSTVSIKRWIHSEERPCHPGTPRIPRANFHVTPRFECPAVRDQLPQMPFLSKPALDCPASAESHQPSSRGTDRDSRPRYRVGMDQQDLLAYVRSFAPSPCSNLVRQQH